MQQSRYTHLRGSRSRSRCRCRSRTGTCSRTRLGRCLFAMLPNYFAELVLVTSVALPDEGALVFNLPHLRLWLGTVSASDPLVPVRSGRLQQLFQTAFVGFLSRMCYRVDDRAGVPSKRPQTRKQAASHHMQVRLGVKRVMTRAQSESGLTTSVRHRCVVAHE